MNVGDTCRNGHLLTAANYYVDPSGRPRCRSCRRDSNRRQYERLHAGRWRRSGPTCRRGHLLAGDNLGRRHDGGRKGRACHRLYNQRWLMRAADAGERQFDR